jgi:DivIVA domain-containing protein
MPEDIGSISSSRLSGADLARHTFTTVRRGFDAAEVRSFLEQIARELAAGEQREEDLRHRLTEAEERAEHPVIDEATLSSALGQQSAQVLRNAHEEAARIALQAEETAASLVREAQRQAAEVQVQAESVAAERIAEAEIARRTMGQQAEGEVGALLEAARIEADVIVTRGIEQGQEMVEQAQETRRRVLADMAQRRRVMTLQIEQFRAARDELAAAVGGLRDSVDRIIDDLSRADDAARSAAADAARRQGPDPTTAEIMAEVAEVEFALDETRARAHELAVDAPSDQVVEVTTAVFDVELEDPDTGAIVIEELEVTVVETEGEGPDEESVDVVDGLFARLRAGQGDEEDAGVANEGNDDDAQAPTAAADAEAAATPVEPTDAGTDEDGAGGDEPVDVDPDDPYRAKRAAALDPIAEQLSKRLKRALQDDQNLLLDRLRTGSGAWTDEVLRSEDEQKDLYADAATANLREATAAGIAFARAERGEKRGRAPSPDAKAVASMADRLAGTVVTLLRRRLEDGDGDIDGGAERVGAAYREWRGARIEGLVGDWVLEAFSSGVLAASGSGGGLRWVVGGEAPPCADCDDNALAGAVPTGDEFPTGHLHPPAHPGCRCLVVPTSA